MLGDLAFCPQFLVRYLAMHPRFLIGIVVCYCYFSVLFRSYTLNEVDNQWGDGPRISRVRDSLVCKGACHIARKAIGYGKKKERQQKRQKGREKGNVKRSLIVLVAVPCMKPPKHFIDPHIFLRPYSSPHSLLPILYSPFPIPYSWFDSSFMCRFFGFDLSICQQLSSLGALSLPRIHAASPKMNASLPAPLLL